MSDKIERKLLILNGVHIARQLGVDINDPVLHRIPTHLYKLIDEYIDSLELDNKEEVALLIIQISIDDIVKDSDHLGIVTDFFYHYAVNKKISQNLYIYFLEVITQAQDKMWNNKNG